MMIMAWRIDKFTNSIGIDILWFGPLMVAVFTFLHSYLSIHVVIMDLREIYVRCSLQC